jgi:hypothetical protein
VDVPDAHQEAAIQKKTRRLKVAAARTGITG